MMHNRPPYSKSLLDFFDQETLDAFGDQSSKFSDMIEKKKTANNIFRLTFLHALFKLLQKTEDLKL